MNGAVQYRRNTSPSLSLHPMRTQLTWRGLGYPNKIRQWHDTPGSEWGLDDQEVIEYIEEMRRIAAPRSWQALCWVLTHTGNRAPPGWRTLAYRLRARVRHPAPLWRFRLALRRLGVVLDQAPPP
jgi:hypothetical protein